MNLANILNKLEGFERHIFKMMENIESIKQLNAKLDETNQLLKDIKEVIEVKYGENKRVS